MRALAAIAVGLFLVPTLLGEALASPLSVCAENTTEYPGTIRLWEAPTEVDQTLSIYQMNHGRQMFRANVGAHEAHCVEWVAPQSRFVVTMALRGAPWRERAQAPGEWLCRQNTKSPFWDVWSADQVLDGVVWLRISDRRGHGYEFDCTNAHNGDDPGTGGVVDLGFPRFSRPG
jgi:hypothetical protein